MSFQTIKTSLKSVVRDETTIEKLTEAALRANRIMTHTLQFLKLYLIHCYDTDNALPTIDKPFVNAAMKIVCIKTNNKGRPNRETIELKQQLTEFYNEHYAPLREPSDVIEYANLNAVLNYMVIDVITMYENNIKQNFFLYVDRFVNVELHKKDQIKAIKAGDGTADDKKSKINLLLSELRKVKNDILRFNEPKTSGADYHEWIDFQKKKIMPQRALREDSVYYDIKCAPQDYLRSMLYMMKAVEEQGCTIYSVFPLRSEIIPKHFRLDTVSLVNLLFTKENGKRKLVHHIHIEDGGVKENL